MYRLTESIINYMPPHNMAQPCFYLVKESTKQKHLKRLKIVLTDIQSSLYKVMESKTNREEYVITRTASVKYNSLTEHP